MPLEWIHNELLSRHTSFAIGGPAALFARVRSRAELLEALMFIRAEQMPYFILGAGSNVLASGRGFDGAVIKNEHKDYSIKGSKTIAASGAMTAVLAHAASEIGLSGLEWAFGIPGTVGGAVRGNAGAFGGEMKDVLECATIFNMKTGEVSFFSNTDFSFAYRRSACADHPEWVIMQVVYRLAESDPSLTLSRLQEYLVRKKETQPLGAHCAGSMFKNNPIALFADTASLPEEYVKKGNVPSGYLIEQVGLKGYRTDRAMISDKHANFFINIGGANFQDIMCLIEMAKKKVFECYVIHLCEEIQYIGNNDS